MPVIKRVIRNGKEFPIIDVPVAAVNRATVEELKEVGTLRQMLVVRHDLKMRKGKLCAQAGHAALGPFFTRMEQVGDTNEYRITMTDEEIAWKEGIFTKICVYVQDDEELIEVYERALAAGLQATLITDRGITEFNGIPTNTFVSIGPATKAELDPITGDLPLY